MEHQFLTYIRLAKKTKDGSAGFLYMHIWKSGWEELVFKSHEQAREWAKKINIPYQKPHKEDSENN